MSPTHNEPPRNLLSVPSQPQCGSEDVYRELPPGAPLAAPGGTPSLALKTSPHRGCQGCLAAPKPDHVPASLCLPATRSTCHSSFWLPCPSLTCTLRPRESDAYIFTPQPPRAELSCCASALGSYRQVLFRKRTDLGVIAHG